MNCKHLTTSTAILAVMTAPALAQQNLSLMLNWKAGGDHAPLTSGSATPARQATGRAHPCVSGVRARSRC